jgi:hypothetical protein
LTNLAWFWEQQNPTTGYKSNKSYIFVQKAVEKT